MTESGPAFFILTPTHNRAARLSTAIDSVRDQSYSNWHLFVLDDGSRDETPQLLARYSDDRRFHSWRFEENQGVNPARNRLLDEILAYSTENDRPGFIVILDDDDRLEKDALARLAEVIESNPHERWIIANCHLPGGERVSRIRGEYRPLCYVRDHKLGVELQGDVAHVFHTSLVGNDRFIDSFPNAEEWWFYAGLASKAQMFAVDLHVKTVEYLDDGLTHSQPNKERGAEIYARKLERFHPFLDSRQRASLEARLGRHLFLRGDRREGWRQLGRALKSWPLEPRVYSYAVEMGFRTLTSHGR